MLSETDIPSPKRDLRTQAEFEGFYPYYAGFPESFAAAVIEAAGLSLRATVYDPWNGSGTTTSAANRHGIATIGFDLNPVMIAVSRARLLPSTEAPSLPPLARELVEWAAELPGGIQNNDPLCTWFEEETAAVIRSIERATARALVPSIKKRETNDPVDELSGIAASLYLALFSFCRQAAKPFRSSNPTWFRCPKSTADRLFIPRHVVQDGFLQVVSHMARTLSSRVSSSPTLAPSEIRRADASVTLPDVQIDLVLTSPPYCTRIDYTAATRVELAVLHGLAPIDTRELGRQMTGTTRVPRRSIQPLSEWGERCLTFLKRVHEHPSKASAGYYLLTHQDYFDKMFRSLGGIAKALRVGGYAVLVVQDSFYKDVHNDVPGIVAEMAAAHGLVHTWNKEFRTRSCMSRINVRSRSYGRQTYSVESVLCFRKR